MSWPHISPATYLFMRHEIARLTKEIEQLRFELRCTESDLNHWYMRAHYSPEEIAEFQRRVSRGLDPETGEWLTPDEQERTRNMGWDPIRREWFPLDANR